jgi:hypothetical protein
MRFECKGVAIVPFRTKSRPRPRLVWLPLFRIGPGTKEATSKTCRLGPPQPSGVPPTRGATSKTRRVLVPKVLDLGIGSPVIGYVLSLKRLPPRLLVLHACSCLCRILPRGTWPARPQPMGLMALTERGKTATWVLPSTVFPGCDQVRVLPDTLAWQLAIGTAMELR